MLTLAPQKVEYKKENTIYWVATLLIVLFDSVGALGFYTEPAMESTRQLGFPDYFRIELALGKVIGGVLLLVPAVPHRFKEWAYVGFGIAFISAIIGHSVMSEPSRLIPPVVGFAVLIVSYVYYHKTRE